VSDACILDTGPLVAFFDSHEEHHGWAVEQFQAVPPKLLTCEAVLTEAIFLLRGSHQAIAKIGSFLEHGILEIPLQVAIQGPQIFDLMRRYQNVPMSLADACIVRISELFPESPVLTLDHDFTIYRRNSRLRIQTIMPGTSA
jgi:predicted nucleic acid-binding protein